jgi:hypothetical protein
MINKPVRTIPHIVCVVILTVVGLCMGGVQQAQATVASDYVSGVNVHDPSSVVTVLGGIGLTSKDVIAQSGMPFGSTVRATGAAIGEMRFAGGSECALQALSSPGAPAYGQITTRVPPGALFSLNGGVANCTVSKAPQDLSICYTGAVYDNSSQSQFDVTCTSDPLFAVAVLHGSVKVLTPNGKKTSVAAGKELTCNPAKCVPVTKRASFTPAQQSIFTTQAKQLGLSIATTTPTAATSTGTIPTNGSPVTASVTTPGQKAVYTFEGVKRQQVSLSFSGNTFLNNNVSLILIDPDGNDVSGTGLGRGNGFISPVTLTSSGTYRVVVDTSGTSTTGQVTLQLFEFTNQAGTITPNGPAVTATISSPVGQKVVYDFTGTKGEQVSLTYSGNTFLSGGDSLSLFEADGSGLSGTGLASDHGFISPVTLPSSGAYQVVVDTSATRDTGSITIQLYEFTNQAGTITPNGPAVTATVTSAGQTITYDFTGTAGEQVTLNYTGDTFPTSSDLLSLLAPDGSGVGSTYLTSASGSVGPESLPLSGTYQVVVDTSQTGDMGAVSITLTTG